MNVVVTGGSGFIGSALLPALLKEHHHVVVLTRGGNVPAGPPGSLRPVQWDGRSSGAWEEQIEGADAIVNLAGESIGGRRWTPAQKDRIIGSRVDATRAIINAIQRAHRKPAVLVSGSAIGFYGDVPEGSVTEEGRQGSGFLAETVERWEREALKAGSLGVRVVTLRTGVVLGRGGGALARMVLPFRLFVGGPIGSGRQWFSWVHRDDVVGAILFTMTNREIAGPVNVTAPESVTMKRFCSVLGHTLHRPSWAPVPALMLKTLLGEMSGMILTGQRVIPLRLMDYGYEFRFPHLKEALEDIVP